MIEPQRGNTACVIKPGNHREVSRWHLNLVLLLIAAGQTMIFLSFRHQNNLDSHVPEFIALALLAGVLYIVGVYVVEKFTLDRLALFIVVAAAISYRIVLLPAKPSLSGDIYRYQWEGRVQRLFTNPYTVYPAKQGLQKLQNPDHPLRDRTPTVYPPLSELSFSWVHTISGYKRLFTALDLATLVVLLWILALLRQSLHRILIYAWNPTVIVSFSLSGHLDSLAILTLMLACLLLTARKGLLSTVFLALSFVSKLYALILLPLFLKRTKWSYAGAFAGVAVLAYLPYVRAGWRLFRGLSEYGARWENNDSLFRFLRLASASKAQAESVAGLLVFGLILYAIWKRMALLHAGLFLTAGLLLLSPNAYPWYFTWTVPFLCFYPSGPWLLMTVTCVLGYSPVVASAAGHPYRDSPFILTLEYGPVLAWLAYEGWRALQGPSEPSGCPRPANPEVL